MNAKAKTIAVQPTPGITFFPVTVNGVTCIDVVAVDEARKTDRATLSKDATGSVSCVVHGTKLAVALDKGNLKVVWGKRLRAVAKLYTSDGGKERWWVGLMVQGEAASADEAVNALFGK